VALHLVIFDCDGVLVDSERLGHRAISEALRELGHRLSAGESERRFRGRRMSEILSEIRSDLGGRLPETFERDLRARMATLFCEQLRPTPGIQEVLDGLAVPYCTASNAPLEKIHMTLGVTGLLPRFTGRIFSAYEIGAWKPDPGIYLHAARTMGMHPATCAVVEDSAAGVQAAAAAGMRVLGFAASGHAAELAAHGATVFTDMAQLPTLLAIAGIQT
jgi:HAD superfamily hydrolase (TIGR01509 family)